ncbi:hypothetical protein Scel_65230 [Streptomyces cellostaticus]|nr:hypothetical protein Scel_65230 [Streptomyces cellostaticus]
MRTAAALRDSAPGRFAAEQAPAIPQRSAPRPQGCDSSQGRSPGLPHKNPLNSACRLRGALRRAPEAFFAALDPVTVRDIVANPTGPLLLGISGQAAGRLRG